MYDNITLKIRSIIYLRLIQPTHFIFTILTESIIHSTQNMHISIEFSLYIKLSTFLQSN